MLKAPNGKKIIGTLEQLHGCAGINGAIIMTNGEIDDPIDLDYDGETDIYWNDQTTVRRNGERVFIDDDANEWLESEVVSGIANPEGHIEPEVAETIAALKGLAGAEIFLDHKEIRGEVMAAMRAILRAATMLQDLAAEKILREAALARHEAFLAKL